MLMADGNPRLRLKTVDELNENWAYTLQKKSNFFVN